MAEKNLKDLSIDELEKLAAAKRNSTNPWSGNAVSQSDPESPIVTVAKRLGTSALNKGMQVLEVYDRYTNAPVRAAVDTAQLQERGMGPGGEPIITIANPKEILAAAADQFGKPGAPDPKDVMARKGVSTKSISDFFPALFNETGEGLPLKKGGLFDVSPAGVAGFGLGMVDPTLAVGPALKGTGAVLSAGANALESTGKAGKAIVGAARGAAELPLRAASKVAAGFTGLPEEVISNYAKRAEEVDKIIASGVDAKSGAAAFRDKLIKDVRSERQKYSKQVGDAITNTPGANIASIDARPILDALEKAKSKFNDRGYDEKALEIVDGFIDKVKANMTDGGLMSVKTLQETKEFLQEGSSKSFQRSGQMIFNTTDKQMLKASNAANQARFEARQILDKFGPEELKAANAKLSELHRIEDNLDAKHFLKNSDRPNPIFTAGTGQNKQGNAYLRRLGAVTGKDYVSEAKDLATAANFGNPQLLPRSAQGTTSTSRNVVATALGGGLGSSLGVPGAIVGAAVANAITSPAALKAAIKTGKFPVDLLTRLGTGGASLSDKGIATLFETLRSPAGQRVVDQYLNGQSGAIDRRANKGK